MALSTSITHGQIRGPVFDGSLIFGCAALALLAGYAVTEWPALFPALLLADVWLLGSHHVIATYTRICFDTDSLKQNKFFVFVLPWLVMLGVAAVVWFSKGRMMVTSIYLYWQWFHYMRQSYGVSRIYQRKGPPVGRLDDWATSAMLYSIALFGIMYRSYQHIQNPQQLFLGSNFFAIPVDLTALAAVGGIALVCLVMWVISVVLRALDGKVTFPQVAYLLSHVVVFFVGYYWIEDITFGWLVVNTWHNSQYILIVWLFNNNRFKNQVDPSHKFLSFISQTRFLWLYFAVCVAITFAFYGLVELLSVRLAPLLLPVLVTSQGWAVVAYQGINFHHYIVDSYIWKVRKPTIQQNLGIQKELSAVVNG